jgi:hypothetical protein
LYGEGHLRALIAALTSQGRSDDLISKRTVNGRNATPFPPLLPARHDVEQTSHERKPKILLKPARGGAPFDASEGWQGRPRPLSPSLQRPRRTLKLRMRGGNEMATRARASRVPGLLLAAALATSLPVLWFIALPVLGAREAHAHLGHGLTLYLHVVGGLIVILAGAGALFIGWTKRGFGAHRWFGYSYLGLGAAMALTALLLSIEAAHEPKSLYVATGTLALVWLAVAAMALRAARNRRFLVHRDWMIRSYVLTWTFVGCRIATQADLFPALGEESVTAAIWVNWIVPLVICEIALQWKAAGKADQRPATNATAANP